MNKLPVIDTRKADLEYAVLHHWYGMNPRNHQGAFPFRSYAVAIKPRGSYTVLSIWDKRGAWVGDICV